MNSYLHLQTFKFRIEKHMSNADATKQDFCQLLQTLEIIWESHCGKASTKPVLPKKVTILATTSEKISKDLLELSVEVVV